MTSAAAANLLQDLVHDFRDVPLYVVFASELPPALTREDSFGWTSRQLDLALQPHLQAAGRWHGRGPALCVSDMAIADHIHAQCDDDPALCDRLVRQWTIGTLLHEAAHALEADFATDEAPAGLATLMTLQLRRWSTATSTHDQALPPFTGHGPKWLRNCLHLHHRFTAANGNDLPLSLVIPPDVHGLSMPWLYQDALGDEPMRLADLRFADIRELPAPAPFKQLYHKDMQLWQHWDRPTY